MIAAKTQQVDYANKLSIDVSGENYAFKIGDLVLRRYDYSMKDGPSNRELVAQ